jgi:hypothetical protein
MKYQGERMRDEMGGGYGGGYGVGDYLRAAKDKVLGGKESAEETAAGGSEFVLQTIDALSDKLHDLRRVRTPHSTCTPACKHRCASHRYRK